MEKHDHRGEWKTTLAPTCTLEGTRERVCDVCGVKESEVLEPLGHTNNEGVETVKPGFFNKGEITYTCTVCSEESKVETGSKVWLFFIILGAAVLLVIGIINYVKIIKKK